MLLAGRNFLIQSLRKIFHRVVGIEFTTLSVLGEQLTTQPWTSLGHGPPRIRVPYPGQETGRGRFWMHLAFLIDAGRSFHASTILFLKNKYLFLKNNLSLAGSWACWEHVACCRTVQRRERPYCATMNCCVGPFGIWTSGWGHPARVYLLKRWCSVRVNEWDSPVSWAGEQDG